MDFWRHWGRRIASGKIVLLTTRIPSALRGWLARRLRQRKARNALRARLDIELLLHALKMREALQEAEEKVRVEIALRTQAEQQARREAEARLEIERVARRRAERRVGRLSGPACPADPETMAKAQREMMARVRAEQLAAGAGSRPG